MKNKIKVGNTIVLLGWLYILVNFLVALINKNLQFNWYAWFCAFFMMFMLTANLITPVIITERKINKDIIRKFILGKGKRTIVEIFCLTPVIYILFDIFKKNLELKM